MNEALAKQGCKYSPVEKSGNSYTFGADCEIEGIRIQSRSVITVESDSVCKVDVTSTAGARSTKELLTAKRDGNC